MSRSVRLALLLSFLGPAVVAQPAAQEPAAPPPPAEAEIGVRQRATLTPQEMINQSREYRQRMEESLKRLEGMVDQARKSKDIIRVNCLLDKLTQIKANISIAEQAIQSLDEAIARNDEGARLHEFTRITIVHQKIQVLTAEGDACIGEDLSYVGATRVDVDVTGIPERDPTLLPTPVPTVDRPPSASPFR